MSTTFENYLQELLEKHLPVPFLDYDTLMQIKHLVLHRDMLGRKELLIIAYIIGATSEESNILLQLSGHPPLYVKKREDAIWKYALDHQMDSASIIEEIFLQNVDESSITE